MKRRMIGLLAAMAVSSAYGQVSQVPEHTGIAIDGNEVVGGPIEQGRMIVTMTAALHDDCTAKSHLPMHGRQHFIGRIRRRV